MFLGPSPPVTKDWLQASLARGYYDHVGLYYSVLGSCCPTSCCCLQVIDQMLRKDYLFDIALPRLPSRVTLERVGQLEPRISVLDEEFDEAALEVGGWWEDGVEWAFCI